MERKSPDECASKLLEVHLLLNKRLCDVKHSNLIQTPQKGRYLLA